MTIVKLLKSIKDALKGFWKRHKYCLIICFTVYVLLSCPKWYEYYEFIAEQHYSPYNFSELFVFPFLEGLWHVIGWTTLFIRYLIKGY